MKSIRFNKSILALINAMFIAMPAIAQDGNDFYSNLGKMYVVVGVIVLVFVGLILFLVRLERRIKKLEKEITNK